MEIEILFAYIRTTGYFILSFIFWAARVYMPRIWYAPTLVGLIFFIEGTGTLLTLARWGTASTFIVTWVFTFVVWAANVACLIALYQSSQRR